MDVLRKSPEPWSRTFPGRIPADVSRSTSPPPWYIAEPHTPVARDFEVFENVRSPCDNKCCMSFLTFSLCHYLDI